jgi:protein-disulfide isomerase
VAIGSRYRRRHRNDHRGDGVYLGGSIEPSGDAPRARTTRIRGRTAVKSADSATSIEDPPVRPDSRWYRCLEGRPDARIAVVEYSDFECPFCARFARTTLPAIVQSYVDTGKLRFGFQHLPLESRHRSAVAAAEAAECGAQQGRFWEMHDQLFSEPMRLDKASLFAKAQAGGLKVSRFRECMDGRATRRIRAAIVEAQALGITGTPTFLFGIIREDGHMSVVRRESGALPVEPFAKILDELLESANSQQP